jgi:predicted Zn-dependent protease
MSSADGPRFNLFRLAPIAIALIAALFLVIKGYQKGPFDRSQIVAMNPQQEAQLGVQAFRQVLTENQAAVVKSGPTVDAVERIGRNLAAAAESEPVLERLKLKPQQFKWEFRVLRSNQVNAFCLPGGKVVVYTGILPVAETESGLATVMGHEIGHALAHHGAERMAQQELVQLGQQAVAQSIGDMDPEQQRQIMGVLGAGSQYGVLLPFSRKHESEADHIGLLLMAGAGYDPREAVEFWKRMDEKGGGGRRPEFSSTHPSHEHRSADLKGWLKEAIPLYERSKQQDGDRPLPRR